MKKVIINIKEFIDYIYYRGYVFSNKISGKEFSEYWAAGFVNFLIVYNITIIIDICFYMFAREHVNIFPPFYKYIAIACLLLTWIHVYFNKEKFKKIFIKYEKKKKTQSMLNYRLLSIIFYIITIYSSLYISELIRHYNLGI